MKAYELAAFFSALPPNTDVKIAACVDGKPVIDSPARLIALGKGILIQTESFCLELDRRAKDAGITKFKLRAIK